MRDYALVALVVSCALVALRQPVFGILAYICFGILNPQGLTFDFGRMFPLSMLTALGTIIGYILSPEPKRYPKEREIVLLFCVWATFAVSTVFAIYPDLAIERFTHTSKILLMVFLTVAIINTEERLRLLLKTIALCLGLLGAKGGFFAIVTGGGQMVIGPELSYLESNNMMGLALAMNVPLLIYLLRRETNRHMKWVIRAMIVLSYPAVVCTFSRGAWIGLAAGTALMVLRGRKKFVMVVCLSLAAILAVPYLPDRVANRYDDLRNYQGERSAQSRFWNWEFCRRVGFSNPLTGGGFNFYSIENYARYYPEFLEQWPGMLWTCHSAWLTVLGEHGILAFLLWLSLILASLLSLRRLRAYARSHPETPWPAPFADSVQAAILVFLIVATFLDAAYFDMFYELIAAIVIAKDVVRREARRAAAPKPDFEPAPMAAQLRAS